LDDFDQAGRDTFIGRDEFPCDEVSRANGVSSHDQNHMSRPIKLGGPPYVPAARGGLMDSRSTGASRPTPQRTLLSDPRSTR